MSEYPLGSVEDREMLAKMPIEKLLDFFFLQIRTCGGLTAYTFWV
jgi:hypothetical protein